MVLRKMLLAGFLALTTLVVVPTTLRADGDEFEEEDPVPPPAPQPEMRPPPPPRPAQPPPPQRWEPAPTPAPAPRPEPTYAPADEDGGFIIEPEVVYLRFRDPDLEFAATGPLVGPFDEEEVEHDYDFGGRLGLGYRWPCQWDFMVRGTVIENDDDAYANDSKGQLLTTMSMTNTSADESFASLDTEMMYIDSEAGYTWGRRDNANFRVFFGMRWVSFEQDAHILNDGEDANMNEISIQTDTDAWGPRVGIEGHVPLGDEWYFLGAASVAALWADSDLRHTETDDAGATAVFSFSGNDDDTVWAGDARLGFGWMRDLGNWSWGMEFGVEAQLWEDLTVDVDGERRDVRLDGAFVRGRFIF